MAIQNVRYKTGIERGQLDIQILDQQIHIGEFKRGDASITRWINAVQSAERLTNPSRKELIELYNDVSIDGYLRSITEKRIRAVSTSPFEWSDLNNDKVAENFRSPWFFELIKQIMDYKFRGHQLIELAVKGGEFIDSEPLPRQNVRPEDQLITYEMYGTEGFSYIEEPYSNVMLEIGKPKDFGIYASIIPYVLMKRDNMAFWMVYNEMFGMPTRVYWYNPHDKDSRNQVVKQAEKQGAAAYIVLPEGARMEFQSAQTATSSQGGGYQALNDTLNQEMTISILGQTLTTSTDGKGSYALGDVHKKVEEGVNMEDLLWMEFVLNYQLKPLAVKHGYPLANIKGSFQQTEALTQEQKLKVWSTIDEKHAPIDPKDWYEEFGVPKPDDKTIQDFKTRKNQPPTQASEPGVLPPKGGKPKAGGDPAQGEKKKPDRLNAMIREFYTHQNSPLQGSQGGVGGVTLSSQSDFDKLIERLIKDLYDSPLQGGQGGVGGVRGAGGELSQLTAAKLYEAVRKGFGKFSKGSPEYDLLLKLRENVYVFSGFKTYQMLKEASSLLITESGEIRAFDEFRQLVLKVHKDYNVNWLLTEYNMAVANSDMARKWMKFEADKDTLPLLRYRSVKDDRARHLGYNNITRPVDDPIWDYLTPPLDWGCRCTIQQLSDGEQTKPQDIPDQSIIKDQFAFNPGKQKVVFPKNHPYYQNALPANDLGTLPPLGGAEGGGVKKGGES